MSLDTVVALIEECISEMDKLNALFTIGGVPVDDIPAHTELFKKLLEKRAYYAEALSASLPPGKVAIIEDEDGVLNAFKGVLRTAQQNVDEFKQGLSPRIGDEELKTLAFRIRQEGAVVLSKAEAEEWFKMQAVIPGWQLLSNQSSLVVGGRFSIACPEALLFESMVRAYEEAKRTKNELVEAKGRLDRGELGIGDIHRLPELKTEHIRHCHQVILNASFTLEAFINALAEIHAESNADLPEADRLYLREMRREKDGTERKRNVRTDDKLTDWVKILSPRDPKLTLEKGGALFQRYRAHLIEYRDSIVHLSSSKVRTYNTIDVDVACRGAQIAMDVISEICRCISNSDAEVILPPWYRSLGE